MNRSKKVLLVILAVLVAIQFIPAAKNRSDAVKESDMMIHFNAPSMAARVLQASCYDCHSNNTKYPWYSSIQPIGWILANHIKDGKEDLNFNEFTTYSPRRQLSKLKSIQNTIKDGSMPLPLYTLAHADAKLSHKEKAIIIAWTSELIDSLQKSGRKN